MQENQWLKSILGEFQGYINEVKQNAQAQGINADFLDLQDGVLNHKAVLGDTPLLLNHEELNNPYANIDDSGMKIGGEYSGGYLYFRSTPEGHQFINRFKKSKNHLKLSYGQVPGGWEGVTNYQIISEGQFITLTKNFSANQLSNANIQNFKLYINVLVKYRPLDAVGQAKSAMDIGHEVFLHAKGADEFFNYLINQISKSIITSKEDIAQRINQYFTTKEARDHLRMRRATDSNYNQYQKELLSLVSSDEAKKAIKDEAKAERSQH